METLSLEKAKGLWLRAQKLTHIAPFGAGPKAVAQAVEHLGYVQIDTISVIERSHHHILYSRIPEYHRRHLEAAQTKEKTVFEYWTHALSYVSSNDLRFFLPEMRSREKSPSPYFAAVPPKDARRLFNLIRKDGAVSIRDIEDEVLVEKDHDWASRKPSKKVLQMGFYFGKLTISERRGMVKTYELMDRHFSWEKPPKPASVGERRDYRLDRALRAQALISLDSVCHLIPKLKPEQLQLIERRVRKGELIEVKVAGADMPRQWMQPELLTVDAKVDETRVHLLSPFDPLTIQRKRLNAYFGYDHRFEAYLPKEKRTYGYFGLPVMLGDRLVAVIDLKTDREKRRLLVQKWTWLPKGRSRDAKNRIEDELTRFEKFQLS